MELTHNVWHATILAFIAPALLLAPLVSYPAQQDLLRHAVAPTAISATKSMPNVSNAISDARHAPILSDVIHV
jgi:hypothetical protein